MSDWVKGLDRRRRNHRVVPWQLEKVIASPGSTKGKWIAGGSRRFVASRGQGRSRGRALDSRLAGELAYSLSRFTGAPDFVADLSVRQAPVLGSKNWFLRSKSASTGRQWPRRFDGKWRCSLRSPERHHGT